MALVQPEQNGRSVSDSELVRRVLEGNIYAFDCLVARHRAVVLNLSHSLVGNWDEAEDIAQQAFLETLSSLRGIRDAGKFRAWLLTITRRCAMRRRSSPRVEQLEYCDGMVRPVYGPQDDPATNALRERVRASLSELSNRNRTVVVLHYLDGYSCREIGTRLGIPSGTVKRILHESRNSLRASMGVETRRQEMPAKEKQKLRITGPRCMHWWMYGNGAAWDILGGVFTTSMYLTVNKKAMSIPQMAEAMDANEGYVRDFMIKRAREDLFEEVSKDRYRTNFVALGHTNWEQVRKWITSEAKRAADLLTNHLPSLREAWNRTALPERGFPWEKGAWPVVAVFVSNCAVSRLSPCVPTAPLRNSGYRYWMGGYELLPGDRKLWTNNVNSCGCSWGGLGFGYVTSHGFDRMYWNTQERVKVLWPLIKGFTHIDSIADDADMTVDKVREIAADLVQLGLVERTTDALRLTFPVITAEADEVLSPGVNRVAELLYGDVLAPAAADVPEKLTSMGFGHLEAQFPVWGEWFLEFIAGEALREMMSRGVLPEPGATPISPAFAMVGWMEARTLATWRIDQGYE